MRIILALLLVACSPTLPVADRSPPSITSIDVVSALPDDVLITIGFDEAVITSAPQPVSVVATSALSDALLEDAVDGDYRVSHAHQLAATALFSTEDQLMVRSASLLPDTDYTVIVSPVWRDDRDNPVVVDGLAMVVSESFTTSSSMPRIIHMNVGERLPRSQTTLRFRYDQAVVIHDAAAVEQRGDHHTPLAMRLERNDVVISRAADRCDDDASSTTIIITGVRSAMGRTAEPWQQTFELGPCAMPLEASVEVSAGDAAAQVVVRANRDVAMSVWIDLDQQGQDGPRCAPGWSCPSQSQGLWSAIDVRPLAALSQHRLWWLVRDDHDQQAFGEEVFTTIDLPDVCITEVMANPSSSPESAGEYIEIHNHGGRDIDLSGMTIRIDDRSCPLPASIVPAGTHALLGGNALLHPTAMVIANPTATLCGALRNSGAQLLQLISEEGQAIDQWTTVPTNEGEAGRRCEDDAARSCAGPATPGRADG
jgi:hypothetical protein